MTVLRQAVRSLVITKQKTGVFKISIPNFLFRADSSAEIGYGHRTRIETLARAVKKAGGEYRIVSRSLPGGRSDQSDLEPTMWLNFTHPLSEDLIAQCNDAEKTLAESRKYAFDPDIVVVDNYAIGPSWQNFFRNHGVFVVAIDDFRNREHSADLVVELLPPPCTDGRLCGLEFLPISTTLDSSAQPLPPCHWRVLVTFGGGDPTEHTLKSVEAIEKVNIEARNLISEVHVVLASKLKERELIERKLTMLSLNFKIHTSLPNLSPLMKVCDVVITSAGNTMVEALAAGRVAVAVITADNQTLLAEEFARRSLVKLLGYAEQVKPETIKEELLKLQIYYSTRMAAALRYKPVDCYGGDRLVQSILRKRKESLT